MKADQMSCGNQNIQFYSFQVISVMKKIIVMDMGYVKMEVVIATLTGTRRKIVRVNCGKFLLFVFYCVHTVLSGANLKNFFC